MILLQVLLFMMPIILGGITNMVWVKLPWVRTYRFPIDRGRLWRDGKPIFGENKTWAGFWGMVVCCGFWFGVMGLAVRQWTWLGENSLLSWDTFNTPWTEIGYGMLWGLFYVLFELPNSFVKRRIHIPPGQNVQGKTGIAFTIIDQADSVIGCIIAAHFFYDPTVTEIILFLLIGTMIHYLVNVMLYVVKLKKQAR